ncbi:hypothetical protein BKA80DRAFT_51214 [Phyllosticta citrichinensis]
MHAWNLCMELVLLSVQACCAMIRKLHFLSRMRPSFPSTRPPGSSPSRYKKPKRVDRRGCVCWRQAPTGLAAACKSFTPSRTLAKWTGAWLLMYRHTQGTYVPTYRLQRGLSH